MDRRKRWSYRSSSLLMRTCRKTVFPPSPQCSTASSRPGPTRYRGPTITFRHTTLGRTPPGEWKARRWDLYLTKLNTHKRQPCLLRDSNPHSQQASGLWPQGHLDRQNAILYPYIAEFSNSILPYTALITLRNWDCMFTFPQEVNF